MQVWWSPTISGDYHSDMSICPSSKYVAPHGGHTFKGVPSSAARFLATLPLVDMQLCILVPPGEGNPRA